MALDPRRRQKKLERRRAKQRAKQREKARRRAEGIAGELRYAARFPVLHCCATADMFEHGMGQVLFSRQLKGGNVAFAMFLVDVYCLGVKDVIMNVLPREQYDDMYEMLQQRYTLDAWKPEAARKLVEGAVQYADSLGLPPHPDYRKARLLFGDVDASACTEQFEYGRDGKPIFISGPNDDPAKCIYVIETLKERCGPDGFHYILGEPMLTHAALGSALGLGGGDWSDEFAPACLDDDDDLDDDWDDDDDWDFDECDSDEWDPKQW